MEEQHKKNMNKKYIRNLLKVNKKLFLFLCISCLLDIYYSSTECSIIILLQFEVLDPMLISNCLVYSFININYVSLSVVSNQIFMVNY